MYQISRHFLEIRLRFFYLLFSLILTGALCYYYQFELVYLIGRPLYELDHKFIVIDLTEAFYTVLRICGLISLLLILPLLLYHFLCFYIPSRYKFESFPIIKWSFLFLFLLGLELVILYFLVFPLICQFLLSFDIITSVTSTDVKSISETSLLNFHNRNNLDNLSFKDVNDVNEMRNIINNRIDHKIEPILLELTARFDSYVKLSTRFYLSVLAFFQIPSIMILFYYYKIIDVYNLFKIRKFIIFSSLLIAAFISPPDIISQIVISICIFIFYEFCLFIGVFLNCSTKV